MKSKSPIFVALLLIAIPIVFVQLILQILPAASKLIASLLSHSYPPAGITAAIIATTLFTQYQWLYQS
jgi:hypothetical protein